jgi:hypothetical protein
MRIDAKPGAPFIEVGQVECPYCPPGDNALIIYLLAADPFHVYWNRDPCQHFFLLDGRFILWQAADDGAEAHKIDETPTDWCLAAERRMQSPDGYAWLDSFIKRGPGQYNAPSPWTLIAFDTRDDFEEVDGAKIDCDGVIVFALDQEALAAS